MADDKTKRPHRPIRRVPMPARPPADRTAARESVNDARRSEPRTQGFSEDTAPSFDAPSFDPPAARVMKIVGDLTLDELRSRLLPGSDPVLRAVLDNDDPERAAILSHGLALPPKRPALSLRDVEAVILRRNLRRRMRPLDLSPRALSVKAGLNTEAVRQIFDGRSKSPQYASLIAIAGVLACDVNDLTYETIPGAHRIIKADLQRLKMMLAERFSAAEQWRKIAKDTADPEAAAQAKQLANALDFEAGPYEWMPDESWNRFTQLKELTHGMDRFDPLPSISRDKPTPAVQAMPVALPALKDLPIYAAAMGGDLDNGNTGAVILDFTPIDHIARPPTLANAADAFGFYVVEDSMSPVYEHGDMVIVKPGLPPRAGGNAVFIKQADDGATYALVKRLESWTAKEWRVSQFHPKKKTFALPRKDWPKCLMIVIKQERG